MARKKMDFVIIRGACLTAVSHFPLYSGQLANDGIYLITVNRGYFERFLHSTLNIFFINCSTDINPTPYLGLNMGPSSFTLKKKIAPLKFLIF